MQTDDPDFTMTDLALRNEDKKEDEDEPENEKINETISF